MRGVPAVAEPAIAIERVRPIPAKRVDFFMFISGEKKTACLPVTTGRQRWR
jgi:hypothetical protein